VLEEMVEPDDNILITLLAVTGASVVAVAVAVRLNYPVPADLVETAAYTVAVVAVEVVAELLLVQVVREEMAVKVHSSLPIQ
jgi:hypothetical protein